MATQPQDNKPAKSEQFKFTDNAGKTHKLPSAVKGRNALSGRDIRDAMLNGEVGQSAFLFKALEAAKPAESALEALYSMSATEAMDIIHGWAQHGDGDGASLGE